MDWPTIVAICGAAVLLVAVLARLHYVFWVRRFGVPAPYAEDHVVRTADGVPITLHRLDPPPTPTEPPILLVHGLAANHRNIDAEPDRSLARHLHDQGRDVWLLTLRSGQPGLTLRERGKAGFSAMVTHDLPEAIRFVRERTRTEAIDYVGFSMGGMLLYAALGRTVEPEAVARVAMIGSPARVKPPVRAMRMFSFLPRFAIRGVWIRLAARMGAFIVEPIRTPFHHHFYNPANVGRGATGRALINLIEDVPAPLSQDFAGWALSDGVVRVDGEDVIDRLPSLTAPAIFFAGAADQIAVPSAVRAAYDAWGSGTDAEKSFVMMSVECGCRHDYGHGDLAIGDHLPDELFAPVADFLSRS